MTDRDDSSQPERPRSGEGAPHRRWGRVAAIVVGLIVLVAVALFATVRVGVQSNPGRAMVEQRLEGMKLGRFGRLHVKGLHGDLLRDFVIDRLTITDPKGVWLEARDIHVVWNYGQLLSRRFHADQITARQVHVLRRPVMGPDTGGGGMPVSVDIDDFAARLETDPAVTYRHGVYDVKGAVDIGRGADAAKSGRLAAASRLHPGDHLNLRFSLGGKSPLLLQAEAREAQGGALAGALGLPADQSFSLDVKADGTQAAGRFTASAVTGGRQPLQAEGRWSSQGARANGRLSLTASSLTRPLAQRLGPEVRFDLVGSPARDGLSQVQARLAADNLTLTATGRVNAGKRATGPQGLALAAAAQDAGALLPGPDLGATRIEGRLTGSLQDWTFRGRATAQSVSASGYALASLGGPVTLNGGGGRIGLQTRLAGTGGHGQGALAGLLGASPTAALQAARLKDGRLSVENLTVRGAGLQVDASGGRNLLGQLSFKGQARVSNLGAIRKGAAGAVAADWQARQSRAKAPWVVSFDAAGRSLSTGFEELTRLLGRRPRLSLQARVGAGETAITRAVLNGAQIHATAAGLVNGPQGARLKVDWQANGPFGIGPIVVTGKAHGTGALTGKLAKPRLDLIADFQHVDVPRLPLNDAHLVLSFSPRGGADGVVALTANSPYGPAKARSDLAFPDGALQLTDLAVDAGGVQAQGSMTLRHGAPSAADLTLNVGPGALLSSGHVAGVVKVVRGGGQTTAALNLNAENARPLGAPVAIRSAHLVADGPLNRLPYRIRARGESARGDWSLNGDGLLIQNKPRYTVSFSGRGGLGAEIVRTSEPATVRFGGGEQAAHLRLVTARGGRLQADATLTRAAADIRAELSDVSLRLVNQDLAGKVDATVNLQGRGKQLSGGLQARLAGARAVGSDPATGLDASVRADLRGDAVAVNATASNAQGLQARADVTLPTVTSAAPLRIAIARKKPMRGQFLADGEVRQLWDLLVGGERSLSGEAKVSGRIAGTLANPRITGQASLSGGRFVDGGTGLVLQQASVSANFADDVVNVVQFRGQDGSGGALSGSGRVSLLRNGVSSFRMTLDNFQVIDNELATASASGKATVDRKADGKMRLQGALTIDQAEIRAAGFHPSGVVTMPVTEINVPPDLERIPPPPPSGPGVALDVSLTAPGRVYVRGRGLDVELSVDAHVGGTTSNPNLSGTAHVVRGDYEFAGKRFTFDERGVIHLAASPKDIRLNLSARRQDPTLTAVINIGGTAAKPDISLSSTPALPQDEVLSHVLFGRSASQLSTLEAARLAAALSSLSGGGGFDVLGNLRSLTGLDRLALVGGEASGLAVAGGKYISDDVYLELVAGGLQGPSVKVEWRASDHLSVVSGLGGVGGADIAVRWRRDY